MSTPIVGAALFRTVMNTAAWRCQCTGQCGHSHHRTEGRCLRQHDTHRVRLIAAPADPATTEREAVTLPAGSLRAWCPTCLTAAQRTARNAQVSWQTTGQCGLFDL